MKKTKTVFYRILFVAVTGVILFGAYSVSHRMSDTHVKPMTFDIETTLADQEKGLGGRTNLSEDYGMLFVFDHKGNYGFWMKDMLVPIDIIWLSDNGTIEKIDASVATSTYPEAFYPPSPIKYVLETAAGEASRRGWNIGTIVALPLPYGK